MNKSVYGLLMSALAAAPFSSHAAIALDRTRAIFPGTEKSISLNISNENPQKPYLAQAWLEDGNRQKISSPFIVVPPLQRLEPGAKSAIRINALPAVASLPQDRESVFWFNVREVPPKSDKPNVMQVALQTRIKLFYRPQAIIPEKYSHWEEQLTFSRTDEGYRIDNPTPYYVTIISVTGNKDEGIAKDFQPLMIAPKSGERVKMKHYSTLYVMTINDFGGKPLTAFNCTKNDCRAEPK